MLERSVEFVRIMKKVNISKAGFEMFLISVDILGISTG